MLHLVSYIYMHSSYDERIQRRQSAQYRKRRAITVKVTLTSSVTLTMYVGNCYSSTFTILSTLSSLNYFVVTIIYMYVYM